MNGDAYRLKSAQFLVKAQQETEPSLRAEFERLAASYARLAEQAERNEKSNAIPGARRSEKVTTDEKTSDLITPPTR